MKIAENTAEVMVMLKEVRFLEVVRFFKKLPGLKGGTFIWVGMFLKNFSEGGVVRLFGMVRLFGTG